MTTPPASDAIMRPKDYRQIVIDTFQGYADEEFEGEPLWRALKIDFKHWTKEHWDALDGKTWNKILTYCIPRGVWIEGSDNQSEILMKLVSAPMYDIYLEDWDMNRINKVAQTYGRVSRVVALRLRHLRGEEPEEIQLLQDTRYQTSARQSEVEPLYKYRPHQSQLPPKQDSLPQQQTPSESAVPITTSFKKPLTAMDVGRLNIRNRRNDNQQAPTPISNQVPNSFTSEIRKDCESIPECSTVLAPPAQVLLAQAPPTNAPLTQAPPAEEVSPATVPLAHVSLVQVLSVPAPSVSIKDVFKVVTPEKFVSSNQVVTHKNRMLTHLPTKVLHDDVPELSTNRFAAYHPHYKEIPGMTKCAYDPLLLRPPPQLSSLPGDWSNNVVKFGTHHLHYNDKVAANPIRTFGLYFLCNFGNLSTTSLISAGDGRACDTEQDLVTEKGEPPRTSLYLLSGALQLLSLPDALSDSIVKHATYHPHYKDEQVSNPTRTSVCAANCLYFLCGWSNLSAAFFLAHDSGACTAEPGQVTKKGEPPRTSLHISQPDQPPSLLLGSTFKNAPSDVCMLGNSKCATMFRWPFSSATYQTQQGTNEKGEQANAKRANRKRARIKKRNTERASTGIYNF